MELTDLTVSNLKPPLSGQKSYWDKNLRGFGIRISAGGAKSWVVQVGPQRKLITLARYPTVSLKEARIAGKRHLAAPVDLTRSISLDAALELFLAHCRATLRPRTVHSYKTTLYRHLTERNGRLRSQTTDRVMATVTSLAATPAEQLHFFNYARTFFGFCVRRKLLQINPLADLPSPAKRNTRHRVLTDQELKAVWLAADQDDTPLARIIQICILTGIRRGEVSKMEWSYYRRWPTLIPSFCAFCLIDPSVRFSAIAIFFTGVLALECARNSFTCSLVYRTRICFLAFFGTQSLLFCKVPF